MKAWISVAQKKEIGKNFRRLREEANMTQEAVFEKAGLHGKGAISNIERAKGYSVTTLAKACEAMGITIKDVSNGSAETLNGKLDLEQNRTKVFKLKRKASVTAGVTRKGEWSIDVGNYRLTIDKEPEYILLEKI